jgi:hypothetical protein
MAISDFQDDEESLLQGEREAEMMIVEAYAALVLAFLSTERSILTFHNVFLICYNFIVSPTAISF